MSNSLWPYVLWPTGLLCPGDSPGKNTGVGCHFLLQGIFPTQESNPGILHCRQILYQLSYWVKVLSHLVMFATPWTVPHTRLLRPRNFPDKNIGVGCHSHLQGIFLIQESNPGILHCKQIIYHLSYQRSALSSVRSVNSCGISIIHMSKFSRESKVWSIRNYLLSTVVAQMVKSLPAMTQVRSLGWEDPLEKEMATHSSILAWRIPWMEEPGGLQSMESQRVRHNWATFTSHARHSARLFTYIVTFNLQYSYPHFTDVQNKI